MADGTVLLGTLDGLTLEGDIDLAPNARAAAVLAHPHPQFGGDRHNPIVETLFRSLPDAGVAVLRFDFRGVGRSEGSYGEGIDERLDIVAAIDIMAQLLPDLPLLLVGYSFGALVTLDVTDARVAAWVAVAPPLGAAPTVRLIAADHRPKLVIAADRDQFTTLDAMRSATSAWSSTRLETLPGADHFLGDSLADVCDLTLAFVDEIAPART